MHYTALHSILQCSTVKFSAVQFSAVQFSAAMMCTKIQRKQLTAAPRSKFVCSIAKIGCIALHCMTLFWRTLHYTALHYYTVKCISVFQDHLSRPLISLPMAACNEEAENSTHFYCSAQPEHTTDAGLLLKPFVIQSQSFLS